MKKQEFITEMKDIVNRKLLKNPKFSVEIQQTIQMIEGIAGSGDFDITVSEDGNVISLCEKIIKGNMNKEFEHKNMSYMEERISLDNEDGLSHFHIVAMISDIESLKANGVEVKQINPYDKSQIKVTYGEKRFDNNGMQMTETDYHIETTSLYAYDDERHIQLLLDSERGYLPVRKNDEYSSELVGDHFAGFSSVSTHSFRMKECMGIVCTRKYHGGNCISEDVFSLDMNRPDQLISEGISIFSQGGYVGPDQELHGKKKSSEIYKEYQMAYMEALQKSGLISLEDSNTFTRKK